MILDSLADATPATCWALGRLRSTSPRGSNALGAVTGRADSRRKAEAARIARIADKNGVLDR